MSSLAAGENFVLSSTSPTLAYLESFNSLSSVSTPTGATQQQQQQQPPPKPFKSSNGRSGSSGFDSPILKPIIPRTESESSFAIMDDEPSPGPTTDYALYNPDNYKMRVLQQQQQQQQRSSNSRNWRWRCQCW